MEVNICSSLLYPFIFLYNFPSKQFHTFLQSLSVFMSNRVNVHIFQQGRLTTVAWWASGSSDPPRGSHIHHILIRKLLKHITTHSHTNFRNHSVLFFLNNALGSIAVIWDRLKIIHIYSTVSLQQNSTNTIKYSYSTKRTNY